MAEAAPSKSGTMAGLSLKNIMKIYPHSGDQKKSKKKKGEPEKKTNLQVTDEGVIAVQKFNLDIADKEAAQGSQGRDRQAGARGG